MLITLRMLKDYLADDYPHISIHEIGPQQLRGVRLMDGRAGLDLEKIYICDPCAAASGQIVPDACYALIGGPDERFAGTNYLSLPADTDEVMLLAQIQGAFEVYAAWENSLLQSALQDRDLQTLVDISYGVFNNPIYIIDSSGHFLLAEIKSLRGVAQSAFQAEGDEIYIDYWWTERYQKNGFLACFQENNGPFFFDIQEESTPVRRFICCRLSTGARFWGFLIIAEYQTPMSESHLALVQVLAYCASQILNCSLLFDQSLNSDLNRIFQDALRGVRQSTQYIDYNFKLLKWRRQDMFSVMAIMPETKGAAIQEQDIPHFRYQFFKILPDSQITLLDNTMVLVVHNSSFRRLEAERKENFITFLANNHLYCGISYEFRSFLEIPDYFEQAKAAANCCVQDDAGRIVMLYEDVIVSHIIGEFSIRRNLLHFIHPLALQLAQYDEQHNSSLATTLFEYLINDRSYKMTAERLHIHKSSLSHRLEKIYDLSKAYDVRIQDPDIKLNLLFSLRIMRKYPELK